MKKVIKAEAVQVITRDIGVITTEIKDITRQAQSILLIYAVEIGKRLEEAKAVLPHGKWGEWLEKEVEFSPRTANNYMRLYEEYGVGQMSVFSNSQSIANFSYTKALQLLSVPADEREAFADEVDADNLSVKELKKAIAERDKALKESEESQKREKELQDKLAAVQLSIDEANAKAAEVDKIQAELAETNAKLDKFKQKSDTLAAKLKKAENDPNVSDEVRENIRAEIEKTLRPEIEAKAREDADKLTAALSAAADEAKRAKAAEEEAKKQLVEYEKKLKLANADVTTFKTLFESLQDTVSKLLTVLEKISLSDAEMADKLLKALDTFIQGVGK